MLYIIYLDIIKYYLYIIKHDIIQRVSLRPCQAQKIKVKSNMISPILLKFDLIFLKSK